MAGGVGLSPVAPGTAGAALGVGLFFLLGRLAPWLYLLTLLTLGLLGVWASDRAGRAFGVVDDGRIVIDEVAGQLLALAPLAPLAFPPAVSSVALAVTGFVAFRVFDVWKPGPVGWAERRFAGGLGVMLDDLVAGALAAGVVLAAMALRAGPA